MSREKPSDEIMSLMDAVLGQQQWIGVWNIEMGSTGRENEFVCLVCWGCVVTLVRNAFRLGQSLVCTGVIQVVKSTWLVYISFLKKKGKANHTPPPREKRKRTKPVIWEPNP